MGKKIEQYVEDLRIIQEMRKIFRKSGRWIQGDLQGIDWDTDRAKEEYCILGGMGVAKKMDLDNVDEQDIAKGRAAEVIAAVIKKHYPDRWDDKYLREEEKDDPANIIPNFNDNSATTIDDVRRVLRLAEYRIKNEVSK